MANTERAFPNIKPTARAYSPGEFPQTKFQAQNGAVTVVRFGNRRVNSSLELSFDNISDAQAADILDHYVSVNDDWDYATFSSSNGSAGANDDLVAYIQESGGSGLRWRYSGPPTVASVRPGRSTVQCSFTGFLDGN